MNKVFIGLVQDISFELVGYRERDKVIVWTAPPEQRDDGALASGKIKPALLPILLCSRSAGKAVLLFACHRSPKQTDYLSYPR